MVDHQESAEAPDVGIVSVQLSGLKDVVPEFVNVVHANSDRDVFQVIFSQVLPPVVMSPEDMKKLREDGFVPGKVISRLVFTPRVYEEMIDVLQFQLENYRAAMGSSSQSPEETESPE